MLLTTTSHAQVYLILDEFIMGGEIQETSKKVRVLQQLFLTEFALHSGPVFPAIRRHREWWDICCSTSRAMSNRSTCDAGDSGAVGRA